MGTDLQQILRSLCFNTEWKYAVLWKLKHRARMVLTWEDAYYDNCEQNSPSGNKCFHETLENLRGGRYSHDSLGLTVAKMSYHVYSLGEGVVGQVAVSGKHQWIFGDNYVNNSCSSVEYRDGWQSQFSAGIKTIVVVAVVPHGVVQLGSLNKVTEDVKLVTHIRDVFLSLQDSSVGHATNLVQCRMNSSLNLPDLPAKGLASEVVPDCLDHVDKAVNKEGPNVWLPMFPYTTTHSDSSFFQLPSIHSKKAVEVGNKHGGVQLPMLESDGIAKLQPGAKVINLKHQNQEGMNCINGGLYVGETTGWKDCFLVSEHNLNLHSNTTVTNNVNLCDFALEAGKFGVDHAYLPSTVFDSAVCDTTKIDGVDSCQNQVFQIPDSDVKIQKTTEKKLENQIELSHCSSTSFKFSAGYELLEALGPAFLKKSNYIDWETEKTEAGTVAEMPEGMNSSQMTFDSTQENLLEAVVASVCHSSSDIKSERSFSKSAQSLLTADKMAEPSSNTIHIINSAGCAFNQPAFIEGDKQQNSSEVCGALSSKGFSSTCPITCSGQLEKSTEPTKNHKKRARPGENCRPRPRDRQLIQDRIKELRELVPNGSKCSIDSLLERTIKHMLFLQSISRHADELSKCAESKMHQKGTAMPGSSSYEQGSTWAVEVGSHLKVCSIVVENLNKNGQMLVEMLCEECSHFLEIAEAIRSLGLTILKGVTEAHGEKTWICFVVEGQNNKVMHRMDILWSLIQVLQTKTTS